MRKLRNLLIGAVAILVTIVALQNTDTVETRLLFTTVSMPRALLLMMTSSLGFVAGLLAGRLGPRAEK